MIAPGLRLVAAVRAGALLVGRPTSSVVHLYRGPVTPSGRWVPRVGRTVCNAHTRRLSVLLEPDCDGRSSLGLDRVLTGGRRVCRRCMATTPAALGVSTLVDLPRRTDVIAAYSSLTPADVAQAGRWAMCTDESHEIGRVGLVLFGARPMAPKHHLTPERAELVAMHDAINKRRRRLTSLEQSPEARAAAVARVEAEAFERARHRKARSKAAHVDKLAGIAARPNGYLTGPERDQLRSA